MPTSHWRMNKGVDDVDRIVAGDVARQQDDLPADDGVVAVGVGLVGCALGAGDEVVGCAPSRRVAVNWGSQLCRLPNCLQGHAHVRRGLAQSRAQASGFTLRQK